MLSDRTRLFRLVRDLGSEHAPVHTVAHVDVLVGGAHADQPAEGQVRLLERLGLALRAAILGVAIAAEVVMWGEKTISLHIPRAKSF